MTFLYNVITRISLIYYNFSKISVRVSFIEISTKFGSNCLSSIGCTRKCCGDAIGDCSTLDSVTLYSAIVSLPKNVYAMSLSYVLYKIDLLIAKKIRKEQRLSPIIKINRRVLIIPNRMKRTTVFHHLS